jgi:hypothetical protein
VPLLGAVDPVSDVSAGLSDDCYDASLEQLLLEELDELGNVGTGKTALETATGRLVARVRDAEAEGTDHGRRLVGCQTRS